MSGIIVSLEQVFKPEYSKTWLYISWLYRIFNTMVIVLKFLPMKVSILEIQILNLTF